MIGKLLQAVWSVRQAINRKVVLLLFIPFAGALVATAMFFLLLAATRNATIFVDMAARLYMHAQQITIELQKNNHDEVMLLASSIDRHITLQTQGGIERGRSIAPAPAALTTTVANMRDIWDDQRRSIYVVLDPHALPAQRQTAQDYLAQHALDLVSAVDSVIRDYENWHRQQFYWMFGLLVLLAVIDLLALALAVNFIVKHNRVRAVVAEKLQESEARFREMAEHIPAIFWLCSLDRQTIFYASPAYERIWGRPVEELYRNPQALVEGVHPDDRKVMQAARDRQERIKYADDSYEYEMRVVRPDGSTRWVRVRTYPVRGTGGMPIRLAGVTEDITAHRIAEANLTRLSSAVEQIADSVFITDRTGMVVYANRAFEQITGYQRAEILGNTPRMLKSGRHNIVFYQRMWLLLTQGDVFRSVFINRRKNGEEYYEEKSIAPVRDANGVITHFVSAGRDITAQRRLEQVLREQVARSRSVLQATHDGFFICSQDGRIHETNNAFCKMLGYTASELAQMTTAGIETRIGHLALAAHMQAMLKDGWGVLETRLRCKDGTLLDVEISASNVQQNGDQQSYCFVRDITARKHAEVRRLEQERAQRDALVHEVHHRIKNNLQGVVGLLRQQADINPALRVPLEAAILQVNTVAVVHGLKGKTVGDELNYAAIVREVLYAITALTGAPIGPAAVQPVAEPVRLAESEAVATALILNELMINAVKHRDPDCDEPVQVSIDKGESSVCTRISNRARGLPAVFDFSTGTGLGTGLTLVKALLPAPLVDLTYRFADGTVTAELRLSPPVVILPGEEHAQQDMVADGADAN